MLKDHLRNLPLYRDFLVPFRAFRKWRQRDYSVPTPNAIKRAVLRRNGIPGSTWVETGTFTGGTTRYLAGLGSRVITVEPEPTLYANATANLADLPHVTVVHGAAEHVFPELLPTVSGDVSFWLDGHYSAGSTYKGEKDCPTEDELREIARNLPRFGKVAILIDDLRCFLPQETDYPDYPSIDFLVDWAREHDFFWHVEHDIFIARNFA